MKSHIGSHHVIGKPGAFAVSRGVFACVNNLLECAVHGDLITLSVQLVAHALGHLQTQGREHSSFVGSPPQNRVVFHEPRENTMFIRRQQSCRRQVSSNCEKAMFARF